MGALLCRVELNKIGGITITVDNKDGEIIHTIVLSSDAITTTSKGDSTTSTITQTPDKIMMDCKTFELTAETITCSSSKKTSLSSGSEFSMESKSSFLINSDSSFALEAATAADIKAKEISVDGTNIKLTGSAQISATAGIIKLQ